MPAPTTDATQPQSFETAIQRLEEIVRQLEQNSLTLEQSMKAFEEGVLLGKFCEARLTEAEQKVEMLVKKDEQGTAEWQPFATNDHQNS